MRLLEMESKRARCLSHNKRSEVSRHHIFFDIESTLHRQENGDAHHAYKLSWACYWRRDTNKEVWDYQESPEKLLDFIESFCKTKDRVYCWAHNAFYDFAVSNMPKMLRERGWTEHSHYFAGGKGSWFFIVKRGSASLVFIDVMNFYQQSLKSLGHLIGEEKQDVDPLTATADALREYCRQDVVIIRKAVERFLTFISSNDLGNVGKTLASTSMNAFRHKFMRKRIEIHKHIPAWRLEHAAYYGGRVELFRKGYVKGPLYYLDINSQYPSQMATRELPHELLSYDEGDLSVAGVKKLLGPYYCIADVTLESDQARYPVRLLRSECQDGAVVNADPLRSHDTTGLRVVYPTGVFRTALSHYALAAAFQEGHIQSVHRLAVYRKSILFSDFVREFWTRRREAQISGNTVDAYLYKILLNSFYGKWGQKQRSEIASYTCNPDAWEVEDVTLTESALQRLLDNSKAKDLDALEINGKTVYVERLLGKERWFARVDKPSYNAFPAISAGVTDAGRELLWSIWQEAGMRNCIYSDTDSVIVTEEGFQRLQHRLGNELGQLKLEHTLDYLVVNGPKDYDHNLGSKHKGVSARAVYDASRDVWEQEQWLRPHGHLRQGLDAPYVSRLVEKRLTREVITKKVLADGELRPFLLMQGG